MTGMPNVFNGSPTKQGKPAGHLKQGTDNVSTNALEVRKTTQQHNAQVKQFTKNPKVKNISSSQSKPSVPKPSASKSPSTKA